MHQAAAEQQHQGGGSGGVSSLAARVPAFSCPPLDVSGQGEGGSAASPSVGGLFMDSMTPDSLSPNSGCTVVRIWGIDSSVPGGAATAGPAAYAR
jgi:hypothetical protein